MIDQVTQVLNEYGYILTKENVHAIEFKRNDNTVYYRPDSTGPNLILNASIVTPLKYSNKIVFHSNYTAFPKRQNKGSSENHYGNKIQFSNIDELREFVSWLISEESQFNIEKFGKLFDDIIGDAIDSGLSIERQVSHNNSDRVYHNYYVRKDSRTIFTYRLSKEHVRFEVGGNTYNIDNAVAIRHFIDLIREKTGINIEMNESNSTAGQLNLSDIKDDIVIIKINKLYRDNMSAEELYEATRGIWKRKIESVSPADYCLSVAKSIVREVYKVNQWYKAGTTPMKSRTFTEEECKNRIEFVGELAPDNIREKYIGKSVANLYKQGEADPVKVFLNHKTVADINTGVEPLEFSTKEGKTIVTCPNCKGLFEKAPRCPECGQLIKYE